MPGKNIFENGVFSFNQTNDVISLANKKMFNIGLYTITEGNAIAARDFKNGLCFGLSMRFIIEERKNGPDGGAHYLAWLKEISRADVSNAKITDNTFEHYINKIKIQYNKQFLATELKSIQDGQYSQNIDVNEGQLSSILKNITMALTNEKEAPSEVNIPEFIKSVKNKMSNGVITNKNYIDVLEKTIKIKSPGFKRALTDFRTIGKGREYTINNVLDNLLQEQKIKGYGDIISFSNFKNALTNALVTEKMRANNYYTQKLIEGGLYEESDSSHQKKASLMQTSLGFEKIEYNNLKKFIRSVKKNTFISLKSPNHAMAISIFVENGVENYSFFDPNAGVSTHHNIVEFENFLDVFFKDNGELYSLSSGKSLTKDKDDFYINYHIHEENPNYVNTSSLWKLARDGENEYILKSLKEKGGIFNINDKYKVKISDFILERNINESKKIKYVILDVISGGDIFQVVMQPESAKTFKDELSRNIHKLMILKDEYASSTKFNLCRDRVNIYIEDNNSLSTKKLHSVPVSNFEDNPLSQRIRNGIYTLDGLSEGWLNLTNLTVKEKSELTKLLNLENNILVNRDILETINEPDKYFKKKLELSELQGVVTNNKEFEKLSLSDATNIIQKWYDNQERNKSAIINFMKNHGISQFKYNALNQSITIATTPELARKRQLDLGMLYLYSADKKIIFILKTC